MNKLLRISLVSALICSPSLHGMVLFGADVDDGTGKPVIWNFDDTSAQSPKRKSINNSLISSPRTLEQNAREDAARENLSGSEDSEINDSKGRYFAEYNSILKNRNTWYKDGVETKNSRITRILALLKSAPLEYITLINATKNDSLNPEYINSIRNQLTSTVYDLNYAHSAISFDPHSNKLVIDCSMVSAKHNDSEPNSGESVASEDVSSEDSDDSDLPLLSMNVIDKILQKTPPTGRTQGEKASLIGHNLLLLDLAPLANVQIINAPQVNTNNPAIKELIRRNLASAAEAVTFDSSKTMLIIDYAKTYYHPAELASDNEQESDVEQISEEDNTTESTTEEPQLTILQKLLNTQHDQIEIIGYDPRHAQHIEDIKDSLLLSLASAEKAVSFTPDNKAIVDLSRIASFPIDATQEEINVRQLFRIPDEEIVLMKGDDKITSTIAEKQAMRARIIKTLQSIVVNSDGTTGIDLDTLQNSALMPAKPAQTKLSLLQAIGLSALKYGSCVGLAYLAFKLSNSH